MPSTSNNWTGFGKLRNATSEAILRRIFSSFLMTLAVLLAMFAALVAYGYSSNPAQTTLRTQKTTTVDGNSCGQCHTPSAHDTGISVTFTGPTTLYAGDYGNYQIVVSKATGVQNRVGIDVAASDTGTPLTVTGGEATTVSNAEVTHSSGLTPPTNLNHLVSNTTSYHFRYTMPAT